MTLSPTVYYWHAPELPQLEANQILHSGHVFPRHFHEGSYAFGLMDEGGSDCLGDGNSFVAPGEVCLLNPGQVHTGGATAERLVSYRMLFLDLALLEDLVEEVSDGRRLELECARVAVHDPKLRSALDLLHGALVRGEGELALEGALVEAVAQLIPYHSCPETRHLQGERERRTVHLAREMLSENLEEKISLDQLARTVGLSRYHFLRVFKKETGLTPHVYRTAQRLECAKKLLRSGIPPAEAALATGFVDQSHFCNAFRRYYGTTPGQYL